MRKVLLATTALVAMSVTAAQADISITGAIEQRYESGDAGDAMDTDVNITITGVGGEAKIIDHNEDIIDVTPDSD